MEDIVIKAIIFDMDGVIANTEPIHLLAWKNTFQQKGSGHLIQFLGDCKGRADTELISEFFKKFKLAGEPQEWLKQKGINYMNLCWTNLDLFPYVTDLLFILNTKYKLAIASSSSKKNVMIVINRFNLDGFFSCYITREDVTKIKPHPEIYLLTARKLDLSPSECLVIEDSIAGVSAAKSAGMICLAVTSSYPKSTLKDADLVVDSIASIYSQWDSLFLSQS